MALPRAGDFKGGAAAAVVSLSQVFLFGLLAFGALGMGYAGTAVRASFCSAIFGAMVASQLGGTPACGASPRASTALVFAALITSLAADASLADAAMGQVGATLFLGAASLALAGLVQAGFGLARLGSLARYVPYPVVAGFMTGVAILIVLAQVPNLIGFAATVKGKALLAALPGAQPGPLAIGIATMACIWWLAPRWDKLPASLVGLICGSALYHLAAAPYPSLVLGPTLGTVAAALLPPTALAPLASGAGLDLFFSHWQPVLATAMALAVIGSLDSLIAAAGVDAKHNTRHNPNRELIGLGLGNAMAGVFGGIPVAFSPGVAIAAWKAGARGRWSGVISSLLLLAALLLGAPLLAYVPLAVLAGIMVTLGVGLVDRWAKALLVQFARGTLPGEGKWSLAVVAAVCGVTVAFNFIVAVVFGLLASMALFIASMSRSLVRASHTGQQRASRRVYSVEQTRLLRDKGEAIRVLELEGAIFFGSVVGLFEEVEAHADTARYIILDMRRVGAIDATGAVMLEQLSQRLVTAGGRMLLAHVTPEGRLGRALTGYRTFLQRAHLDWYKDVDYALEAAERALLESGIAGVVAGAQAAEMVLEATALLSGLRPGELELVRSHLERRELAAGEALFHEGDPGDRLYVLTQGSVTIQFSAGRDPQRIATFEPGIIFGEMAMLDGVARSASALAEERVIAYSLSSDALERILAADPGLGNRLLTRVGRHLANRLRLATDMLRALSGAD